MAAPVAVFAHLILNRKIKEAAGFAAGMGALCLAGFAAMQWTTGGWFAFHMFATHPDRYSLAHFLRYAGPVWLSAPVVTALAVWYAVRDWHNHTAAFPPLYLAMSSLTTLTAGKIGANANHFIEWMGVTCLCAGLGYSVVLSKHFNKAMSATLILSTSVVVGSIVQSTQKPQPTDGLSECGLAYQYVATSPASRVFSENLGALLMAGKPVLVSDPFVYLESTKHGKLPDRQVEKLVNERYFDLIVMSNDPVATKLQRTDVWPDPLLDAIGRNYRLVERFSYRNASVMMEPVAPNNAPR